MLGLFQMHDEDPGKDKTSQNCVERDLEHAARSLGTAREEICRLAAQEPQGQGEEQRKLGKREAAVPTEARL